MSAKDSNESPSSTSSSFQDKRKKFQELKERREKISKGSELRRIKTIQNQAMKKVLKSMKHSSKEDRNILEERGIQLPKSDDKSEEKSEESSSVDPYLKGADRLLAMSNEELLKLNTQKERQIRVAISQGLVDCAETMSNELSIEQHNLRSRHAVEARTLDLKRKAEAESNQPRRKKLQWGFDAKQAWEMKGNM